MIANIALAHCLCIQETARHLLEIDSFPQKLSEFCQLVARCHEQSPLDGLVQLNQQSILQPVCAFANCSFEEFPNAFPPNAITIFDICFLLALWFLLCDTVYIAAPINNFYRINADNFFIWEHRLNLL